MQINTSFYTSGFLYSLKTHQILLVQSEKTWSILGGEGNNGEEAQIAFARIVSEKLNINLKAKDIYPVYDYFQETRNTTNYVFYAQVKNSKVIGSQNEDDFTWVSFSEVSKLPFKGRAKQDVIVLERVINAKWRDDEAISEKAAIL